RGTGRICSDQHIAGGAAAVTEMSRDSPVRIVGIAHEALAEMNAIVESAQQHPAQRLADDVLFAVHDIHGRLVYFEAEQFGESLREHVEEAGSPSAGGDKQIVKSRGSTGLKSAASGWTDTDKVITGFDLARSV